MGRGALGTRRAGIRSMMMPLRLSPAARWITGTFVLLLGGCQPEPVPVPPPPPPLAPAIETDRAIEAPQPLPPPAAPATPEETPYGIFAFADTSGRLLLALDRPSDSSMIRRAICKGGEQHAIRFLRHQTGTSDSDGRDIAYNFANEEGLVFEVVDGVTRPDMTCFLATDSLLGLGAFLLPNPRSMQPCISPDSVRAEAHERRTVTLCRTVVTFPDSSRVLVLQFVQRGDSALGSIAVVNAGTIVSLDFPARVEGEGGTWREGDGGVFDPDAFEVLFVIRSGTWAALALAWAGEEGESLWLTVTGVRPDRLEESAVGYRYWAPR